MSVLHSAKFPASDFAEPLLKTLDASVVESIDASDYEGASIIADFNKPLGDRHHGTFASFIDFGARNISSIFISISKRQQDFAIERHAAIFVAC